MTNTQKPAISISDDRRLHALAMLEQYAQRAKAVTDQAQRVQVWTGEKAIEALDAGASYGDLAQVLNISRQAAHKRYSAAVKPDPTTQPDLFSEGN